MAIILKLAVITAIYLFRDTCMKVEIDNLQLNNLEYTTYISNYNPNRADHLSYPLPQI